jgi:amicoumacin kinase
VNEDDVPLHCGPQRDIAAAVTNELIRNAADLWRATDSPPRAIRAVQNHVFAIERREGPATLRLTHQSHRSVAEVEAELHWMIDLKGRGLPVAEPHRSQRNALTETLRSNHGHFVATCFESLPGLKPEPTQPELWSDGMFEQLGVITAKLHQASYDAAWSPATLARRTWREESVVQNFHFYVPVGERLVHRAFDRVLAKLDSFPRSRESFGLIHADLNHTNFFIAPGGLNIFDFDDSCYCWFAYDLLVPIFHFPAADQAEMDAKAQHAFRLLRRGYETVRRFNPAWWRWLSLLLQWRDLLIYGSFYEQLEIAALPDKMRSSFLAMRDRIEAGRPIADLGEAG